MCQLAICSYDRVSRLRAEKTKKCLGRRATRADHATIKHVTIKWTIQRRASPVSHITQPVIPARFQHDFLYLRRRDLQEPVVSALKWDELVIRQTRNIHQYYPELIISFPDCIDEYLVIRKLMEISVWSKWNRPPGLSASYRWRNEKAIATSGE